MSDVQEEENQPSGRFADLARRTLTAVVLVPPVLALVWLGGWPLQALLTLSAGALAREWSRMTGSDDRVSWISAFLAAAAAAVTLSAYGWMLSAIAIAMGTALLLMVERGRARPVLRSLAIVIAVVPVVCFDLLRGAEGDQAARITVLWLLAVVWATDIGAYLAGRTLGGPKLMPRISPKKTWSGALGGVAAAVLASLAVPQLVALEAPPESPALLILSAAVLSIVAQGGDLVESAVKRICNFKDSGGMLPGHGGLLDRVDGLIAAATALAAFVLILGEGPF